MKIKPQKFDERIKAKLSPGNLVKVLCSFLSYCWGYEQIALVQYVSPLKGAPFQESLE